MLSAKCKQAQSAKPFPSKKMLISIFSTAFLRELVVLFHVSQK